MSKREMASLDELPAEQRPFISDISLWEVAVLLELGRWNVALLFPSNRGSRRHVIRALWRFSRYPKISLPK